MVDFFFGPETSIMPSFLLDKFESKHYGLGLSFQLIPPLSILPENYQFDVWKSFHMNLS
jgi:hypothetical protein